MEIKTVVKSSLKKARLSVFPQKKVTIYRPLKCEGDELTTTLSRGKEICAYLEGPDKEFVGTFGGSNSATVWENIAEPVEVIRFEWKSGVRIVSRRPYERKGNAKATRSK